MPRTLAQNAQYINETIKPAIKSAIEAQGVTVPSTDSFLDYADRIGEIEGGGSGYQLKDLPTGSVSTVSDAAELPLNALKVSVEAVQDLHGQSVPYPEGGSAQKWDEEWEVGAYNTSTGEKSTSTTKIRCKNPIPVNASTTYYALTNSYAMRVFYYDSNNAFLESPSAITNSTFTTPSNCAYITFHMADTYGTTYGNNLGINYPSSDTSYHPYSNICPIEGWDSGEIDVVGKNIWDSTTYPLKTGYYVRYATGTVSGGNDNFRATQNGIPVEAFRGQTIYCNHTVGGSAPGHAYYDSNDDYISGQKQFPSTVPTNASYLRFTVDAVDEDVMLALTPFTEGEAYVPYQGKQYTQQFPQTIYGAEWDVVNGELKQTDGYIASYNGESLPSTWISDRDVYASGTTPTTGAQVVYKLATPTTISLSPLSIRMLQGTNNIYADCGDVIEGEYFVDEGAHRYQLYDYIESDGTQVIDLGFAPENGATVTTSFVLLSTQTSEAFVYGATDSSAWLGFAQNPASRNTIYENNTTGRSEAYIQNQQYLLTLTASRDYTNHLCMFGFYLNGYAPGIKTRLCYCKYNDNFYLPAKRKSDGVFGLYDVANQSFLTDSAGGNAFVGGNPTGVEV